jgi:ribonuclease-3
VRFLRFLRLPFKNHRFHPLEKQIHYRFKNPALLEQAFTHRSVNPRPRENYERLEFLGDAVVDIVVSRLLMKEYTEGDEGLLTQKRSALVQKSYLAAMGQMLNLLDYLKIEPTVNLKSEKIASRQQANLFEALIGALFLDGGLEPCRQLILNTVWTHREEAWLTTNYKGRLIEYCHSHSIGNPRFKITSVTGPEHQKIFEVHVKIGDHTFPAGLGTNKKAAEQAAAQNALEMLQA